MCDYFLIHLQCLVIISTQLAILSVGAAVAYPTVLLQQYKNEELEISSWIGSIHGLSGIPSIFMLSLMQWKGRKIIFITTCLILSIGWLLAYLSTNVKILLLSESFQGFGCNSLLAISQLSMSEMLNPKYRNISMHTLGIVQALGMTLLGVTARYMHWKTVSLVMCAPIVISTLIGCVWSESPSWLASKGKFDECAKTFTSLRGTGDSAIKEMNEIIAAQKKILASNKLNERSLKYFWKQVSSRDFYLPSLHMFVLMYLMYWSGSMVVVIYSIDLIEKSTTNEISSFGGIIMSAIMFTGISISCALVKFYDHKPLLLRSTIGVTFFLVVGSCVNYLQRANILYKDSLLCLYSLMAFMIVSASGVMPLAITISAELMPVRHRGLGGALYDIYTSIFHASSLKFAPYLLLYIDLWGALLVYALNASVCGLLAWKYIPETKGRTLQEIENYYMFGRFHSTETNESNRLIP